MSRFPLLIGATALTVIAAAEPEPGEEFCAAQGGTANVRLASGRRLDCLDEARGVAWAVAAAADWAGCYNRAQAQIQETSLRAGCALIIRAPADCTDIERIGKQALSSRTAITISTVGTPCP